MNMNVFLHVDLNIFMMVICVIMYFSSRGMNEKQMIHYQVFRLLILSDLALLALEVMTWLLEGHATPLLIVLYYIVTILLYLLTPIPSALWALFVHFQLFHNRQTLKKEMVVLGIPIAVCTVLTLTTPLTGLWFTIDSANVYQRGFFYPIFALLSFWPIIYASISIVIHRDRLPRRLAVLLLLFTIPPVIGSVVQVLYYGTTLLWSSITISIFLVYSNMQTTQIYMDHLTGVYNRRQLDTFLTDRMKLAKNRQPLSCILLDIDHFKKINDNLGHVAGDAALKDASAILKNCIQKGDFLARFGGDEFIILTDICDEATLKGMCERIRESVRQFNQTQKRLYTLDFSMGSAVYDPGTGWDKSDFIAYVDALMYQNKSSLTEL